MVVDPVRRRARRGFGGFLGERQRLVVFIQFICWPNTVTCPSTLVSNRQALCPVTSRTIQS